MVSHAHATGWTPNLEKAKERAAKEGKPLLLRFTGSNWCMPCIHLDSTVFSESKFLSAASQNYVLVVIDRPEGDKEMIKKAEVHLAKSKVKNLPSLVIITPDGKEIHRVSPTINSSVNDVLRSIDPKNIKK